MKTRLIIDQIDDKQDEWRLGRMMDLIKIRIKVRILEERTRIFGTCPNV